MVAHRLVEGRRHTRTQRLDNLIFLVEVYGFAALGRFRPVVDDGLLVCELLLPCGGMRVRSGMG